MIRPSVDMMEALRLTRQGRLEEAMAVLRGGAAPVGEGSVEREAGKGTAPVLDMVPPSVETGGAWTAPPTRPAGEATQRADNGSRPPSTPSGFLDRLRRFDLPGGWERAAGAPKPAKVVVLAGATFETCDFANEAGSRRYKLYVPSCYKGQAMPLVLMLHGCSQSPDDFAAGTRMNECAEEQGLFVAYPAQPASANPSRCWNWFEGSEQRRDQGEPSLIAGLTRQIMRDVAVDAGRVYVAGLSAGGAAAAIMGATYPDLYAAVGVHSGLAYAAANDVASAFAAMRHGPPHLARPPARPLPLIVFHGDRDATVAPANAASLIHHAVMAASPDRRPETLPTAVTGGQVPGGHAYSRTRYQDPAGTPLAELWTIHESGHAWSGGIPHGSYTDPDGPDASAEFIRFFLEHPAIPPAR